MEGAIREARPADVPSLEVVRRQALERDLAGEYDRSEFAGLIARSDAPLAAWIDAPDSEYLVSLVETDVTVVCYGVYDRGDAAVRGLYTAPEYRRLGCASALLDRFESTARGDGVATIEATVPRPAAEFFVSRGFETRGSREWRGLSGVKLSKRIE